MLSPSKILYIPFLILFLLTSTGCGLVRRSECRKMEQANKKLISGKETFGVKNKKYKKKSRKNSCSFQARR